MRNIIKICIVLMFASCHPSKIDIIPINLSQNLKGEVISQIDVQLPYVVKVVDTFLFICNQKGEFFFEVYSTKSYRKITEFGTEGRGPNEFVRPILTGQTDYENNNKFKVHVYDLARRRVSFIDDRGVLNNTSNHKPFLIPTLESFVSSVNYLDQNYLVSLIAEEKGRGNIYNIAVREESQIAYKPKLTFKYKDSDASKLFKSTTLCVNQSKKEIASALYYTGQIDFFDFSGEYLRSIYYTDHSGLKECYLNDGFKVMEQEQYIYSLERNGEELFGMNVNSKLKDLVNGTPNNTVIHRFAWDGTKQDQYILDRQVDSFTYDPCGNCFYCVQHGIEKSSIVKFQIKNEEE